MKGYFPAPECDDPLVMMQTQMEVCKIKCGRRITLEVSKDAFGQARENIRAEKNTQAGQRREEHAKKAPLAYIQAWLSRDEILETAKTTGEETEEVKGRKAYLLKIREMIFDLRRSEIYPLINGYQEVRTWQDGKLIFTICGNPGCGIWFRRFVELSKSARVWELNAEGGNIKSE